MSDTPRHLLTLQLRDASATPDAALTERLARRKPYDDDLAIQDIWKFRAPVIKLNLAYYEPPVFTAL